MSVDASYQKRSKKMSRAFIWRRVHSLLGLWLVLFLMEHLFTNSQAAMLMGDWGGGFIRAVNFLGNLPYLHTIEAVLLGIPILLHGYWGIRILLKGKSNSNAVAKNSPSLPSYARNHAYTWQRVTSWIVLVGIILHVGYMRFYQYPVEVKEGRTSYYMVRLTMDRGLYEISNRLGVTLYDKKDLEVAKDRLKSTQKMPINSPKSIAYNENVNQSIKHHLKNLNTQEYLKGLLKRPVTTQDQVIGVSENFGTAILLNVRDAFRSPFKAALYTIFVLATCFHAFNGLWTFMLTWGLVLRMKSQKMAVNVCAIILCLVALLGLIAVWGTYISNFWS